MTGKKDRQALIAYMKTCLEAGDWHAVSDCANDLREEDARAGRLGGASIVMGPVTIYVAEGTTPESAQRALDDALLGIQNASPARLLLRDCARAAVECGVRCFFGEEPTEEDTRYKDDASPEEHAKLIVRELERATHTVEEARGAVRFVAASLEALGVDDEEDALARLKELGQVKLKSDPPPADPEVA